MDKKILFKALNTELAKENISLDIICVGGFVLEYYNLRGTQDVDAFYQEGVNIRQMIKKVGDEFGVNEPDELWLNNSVANLNRIPPKTICETVFHYSNLIVLVPPLSYILGMKLESGRDRDRQDAGDIIKLAKIRSPKKLINTLEEYGFQPDISMILEVFEIAYGMEWLANYMSEHPEEFRHY
ncbi:TPA: potassium transporter peripheral membrane component [Streptococcus equi subsp. zooepidemicus]|nr:potassium transporter peripheral membrane component [Streptococcus equi subsp. zooepidemicus]